MAKTGPSDGATGTDAAVPIGFPDYRITVETPGVRFDPLPWFDFDNVTIEASRQRISNLGHAGILILRGADGYTNYYEYGRYDPAALGIVKKLRVPNVNMSENGFPTRESLKNILRVISHQSGHNGRIVGAYIRLQNAFKKMQGYAESRQNMNTKPDRKPYSIMGNNCLSFSIEVAKAGGSQMPNNIDPRPNGYIDELRDHFLNLDCNARTSRVTLEGAYT